MSKSGNNKTSSVTARTLSHYARATLHQWPILLLALAATLGFILFLSFGNPYVIALVIDRVGAEPVAPDAVLTVFGPYIAAFIGLNALGQIASKLQDYAVWKLQIRVNYELATTAFATLSNQSMTFHSNRYGGSLVAQTQKFISAYSLLVENLIYAIIPIVCSAAFTCVILAPLLPSYVACLVLLLIIYTIVAYLLYKRVLPLNASAAAAQNALSGELSDSITNLLAVKTYGREDYERGLFNAANRDVLYADSRRMRSSTFRGAVTSFILVLIMALVVLFITGGNAWFGISAGTLVMIFSYTYQSTMQFNRINMTLQMVNRALGDAHEMTLILDEPTLVADIPGAPDLVVEKGAIAFVDVAFAYHEGRAVEEDVAGVTSSSTAVFADFTLEIPAGQRIGLVGRSGSGKTTLTALLLRLSDLQAGRILVDGQDISRVTQVSLRQSIAYVPQEPLLFHRTVAENIAYGRPQATLPEIRAAAAKANALEFIEALPHGFQTITGERGVKLSGGQRQRVAIARAILANKPILVLDEATSALDSESEKYIQDALRNLMEGRTSIVVAHRLSTVASLDRIVVLSDGKVVEDGTHAQLVSAGGEYARLWSRQSGAFLGS
ncbi:MAG: ABC transporter ATP-binding protein/permease [Coriobacteriales bacterium]|nr:ABC transporter ATP-binding protein/permease [Coriobacteriales bacterium]